MTWLKMDAAAVKTFINSDGQITEFAFDEDNKTVYAGEERTVIFNGNDEGIYGHYTKQYHLIFGFSFYLII